MQSRRSHNSLMIMFLFMVIAFTLLAYRSETNARHIKENVYNACKIRNENTVRTNEFNHRMAAVEKKNPYWKTSPITVEARIKLYNDAILQLVKCHPVG